MTNIIERMQMQFSDMNVQKNIPLSGLTTLRVGGKADYLLTAEKEETFCGVLRILREENIPCLVLGNGSNLLVKDGGFRGVVLKLGKEFGEIRRTDDGLYACAGALMSVLSRTALEYGLEGLEFAQGIPGTVGGGVYMNAGAYGGEMSQVVTLVEGYDMTGEPFQYNHYEMQFGHRHTRLMDEGKLVTHVTFQLHPGKREELLAEMVDFNTRRAEKQPLTQFSAGSTFKRPANGYASAMIDQCGLKGYTVGGAQVSEKHAGFCINNGGTAADFLQLIAEVQKAVYEKFGTMLEPEVRILGEDAPVNEV